MPERLESPSHSNITLNEVLFALFKHKRRILLSTAAGLVAAGAFFLFFPPLYESQAKLLVRYVLERSAVDPIDTTAGSRDSNKTTDSVIGSEVEILTSWDLAVQVADAIGAKRLLKNTRAATTPTAAAEVVSSGLEVTSRKGSNIIFVSYKNRDPELATLVLDELVKRYFNKHLEVHRSAGAFDFVTQQTDQVRARLSQTEDTLASLTAKAGIFSLAESSSNLNVEMAKTEEELHTSEAELAEAEARVRQLEQSPDGAKVNAAAVSDNSDDTDAQADSSDGSSGSRAKGASTGDSEAAKRPAPGSTGVGAPQPTNADIQQYGVLVTKLTQVREAKLDLLGKYSARNRLVKSNQAQIDSLQKQITKLEKKFPDLPARTHTLGSPRNQQLDLVSERAQLAGLMAKTETLRTKFHDLQERRKQLAESGPRIADLERKKELDEANYKYFENTLEKARVDEALDPSKMPNISAVQRPSPAMPVTTTRDKIALALAGGGLAVGLALALLNELVLNRTLKRPLELEKRLQIPLLLSIPYSSTDSGRLLLPPKDSANSSALALKRAEWRNLAPWEADHFIQPYCGAIRDRLNLYFALNNMTHKPKLVGVTSFSEGAGSSTLAAGLAATLSETEEGKVLLVDVNLGPEAVHPFFRGRPAYSLDAALQPQASIASAMDNLYLATVAPPNPGPPQLGLKKFFELMPNLKASDFDYIIFDMPPLSQTSPTFGMAGFMDKVLLLVEADKNNRDLVKRGYAELLAGRARVSVILNKTRSYLPKWLDGDS